MILTGRAAVAMALGVVAVIAAPASETVIVWAALVALLCVVDMLRAASPRQVAITREVPGSVRLTQTTTARLTLRVLGRRRLRGVVRDAWQPSAGAHGRGRHPVDIRSGDGTRLTTALTPRRRGDLTADKVTIRTLGPLGLAGRQASLTVPGRLRVLPEFAARRHLPSRLMLLREIDGAAAVQIRGQGTEFDSLREYVIGDDVRSIDWRATARRNDVVVRTWRPERDRRVLIVLDTSRTSAIRVQDAPRLDAGIEATLLLAALTSHAGDRVEVIAMDRRERARVAGASGARLLSLLGEQLADVHPELIETDWSLVTATVKARTTQRSLVVLVTALEPGSVEKGLMDTAILLQRDHQVVIASAKDPETDELRKRRGDAAEVFDAAAAERVELERQAVAARLAQRGVEVVDALPDALAPRLADTYLALKAAGRL